MSLGNPKYPWGRWRISMENAKHPCKKGWMSMDFVKYPRKIREHPWRIPHVPGKKRRMSMEKFPKSLGKVQGVHRIFQTFVGKMQNIHGKFQTSTQKVQDIHGYQQKSMWKAQISVENSYRSIRIVQDAHRRCQIPTRQAPQHHQNPTQMLSSQHHAFLTPPSPLPKI